MKISEIITESIDMVNDALKLPYGAAGSKFDALHNPEIVKNIKSEYERYRKLGENPVFLRDEDNGEESFTATPKDKNSASPGYLAREQAFKRAGIKVK